MTSLVRESSGEANAKERCVALLERSRGGESEMASAEDTLSKFWVEVREKILKNLASAHLLKHGKR